MQKRIIGPIAAISVIGLGIMGCLDQGPTGPAGPKLTGNLSGFVVLVNANGSQPVHKDSITVSLEGTNSSTLTDTSGAWTLTDIATGIYTISVSKLGYGISKVNQFQFIGGDGKLVGTTYLCAAPAYSVTRFWQRTALISQQQFLCVDVGDTSLSSNGRIDIFLGHDSLVSFDPARYSLVLSENVKYARGTDSTTIKLQATSFATAGFAPGDTVWAVAYTTNTGNNSSGYIDPSTGRTFYTNLSASRSNAIALIAQ